MPWHEAMARWRCRDRGVETTVQGVRVVVVRHPLCCYVWAAGRQAQGEGEYVVVLRRLPPVACWALGSCKHRMLGMNIVVL